ncbi:MAG: 4'-phosphopantetheinyl transferase superfamily protein [Microlunatus sp.]
MARAAQRPGTDVLVIDVAPVTDREPTTLDAHERNRLARLRRTADRARYLAAHVRLRELLAEVTGRPPADLRFSQADCPACGKAHGRPVLTDHPDVHFSLAHAGSRIAVAIAAAPVGIDVEALTSVPGEPELSTVIRHLHPREVAELQALPAHERGPAFLACWTRKEAWRKGVGTGIAIGLDADVVGVHRPVSPAGWTVADLDAGAGHSAALAVRT